MTVATLMEIKGVRSVEEQKKIATTSKIVGALVESEANALEALEIVERAKQTFLERCWHVSSYKKSPQVAVTTSEENFSNKSNSKFEQTVKIIINEGVSQKEAIDQIRQQLHELVRSLPIKF